MRTDPETVRKIGNLALVCNDQAWMLATSPARDRDSEVAVRLARLAVAVAPEVALYLNTLGVAEYRAGHLVEAIATLEKSLEASRGKSDAFDLFFLAMARHRSGESARANADFGRAVRWQQEHPQQSPKWAEELKAFQAEAEAVLAGPPGELASDPFAQ